MDSSERPSDAVSGTARGVSPRLLAFYLPQFHPTPENDVFWGEGFTEWSAVVRTKPLFPGHYQPRIPADLGFYDLRLPEVRQAQADLAREHGVGGFVYYHYWFEGRRVLERPFEEMLGSGHPDFPFCLCWANHNWTWMRDARDRGRLMLQEYGDEDSRAHARYLLEVFEDGRYIKVNGRPLVLVYRAHEMPEPGRVFEIWREEARKAGVAEPYILKMDSFGNFEDPAEYGCDAAVEFWPHAVEKVVPDPRRREEDGRVHLITEYRDLVDKLTKREAPPFTRYPCVIPGWDNTARFKTKGARVIHNSTPELYEDWLRSAIEGSATRAPDEQLVFVNAWNEWAEGAYLEPDYKYGRAYLEATRRALEASGVEVSAPATKETAPAPASTEELYGRLRKKYVRLQESLVEQLGAEENSPLLQKSEQQVKDLRKRNNKLTKSARALELDRERLARWMQEMDDGVTALLESRRWRLGGVFFETARRVLGKPQQRTVEDHLLTITDAFRDWKKDPDSVQDHPKDPPNDGPKDPRNTP